MHSRTHNLKIIFGCILFSFNAAAYNISFDNVTIKVISISPDKSTGIDKIYVLSNISDEVSMTFESEAISPVEWYSYSNLGGAYAQQLKNIHIDGKKSTLHNVVPDMGYIINDGNKNYIFWIIDYSKYTIDISNIILSENQECNTTILDIEGDAPAIYYYTINGKRETLDRGIECSYNNLEWDNENMRYNQRIITKQLPYINHLILLSPPIYCSTTYRISGDTFLKEWGEEYHFESMPYSPYSIDIRTFAEQNTDDDKIGNLIKEEGGNLGGSAPCEIEFMSYVSDAVRHIEWQMATDPNFNDIKYRITEPDLTYTFMDDGTTYIRCIASNADGSCESFGNTYTVEIGSSELKIPNIFTPDGDGVNDVWKVSYRSLIDFKCWIYDRYGHEIFYFENPADGWDGKYNGKYLGSGVFFYVVTATGADGKNYKKSGDINIITHQTNSTKPIIP